MQQVGVTVRVINVHSDSYGKVGVVESHDSRRGLVNVRVGTKLIGYQPKSLEVVCS